MPAGSNNGTGNQNLDGLVLSDLMRFLMKMFQWTYLVSLGEKPNEYFKGEVVSAEDIATAKTKTKLLTNMITKLVTVEPSLQPVLDNLYQNLRKAI